MYTHLRNFYSTKRLMKSIPEYQVAFPQEDSMKNLAGHARLKN